MTLNSESKYSSRRTYVLKLRSDAKPDALVGRLENMVTGQQHEFASNQELVQSIANDLRANAPAVGRCHGSEGCGGDPMDIRQQGKTE
jgi:hypothetical protein